MCDQGNLKYACVSVNHVFKYDHAHLHYKSVKVLCRRLERLSCCRIGRQLQRVLKVIISAVILNDCVQSCDFAMNVLQLFSLLHFSLLTQLLSTMWQRSVCASTTSPPPQDTSNTIDLLWSANISSLYPPR